MSRYINVKMFHNNNEFHKGTGGLVSPFDFTFVPVPAVVVAAAGVELTGTLLFIFSASSSGLEAADGATGALLGLGSRLMTGMVELLDVVGRGAARRLLRGVVGGGLEAAVSGEGAVFSGSGSDP